MSLLFKKKHLRLEVPETTDGMNLKYDEAGRNPKKIVVLPLSARRFIERNDAKKPAHLRATITVVEGDQAPKVENKQAAAAPAATVETANTVSAPAKAAAAKKPAAAKKATPKKAATPQEVAAPAETAETEIPE